MSDFPKLDDYTILKLLGKGTFSSVYLAKEIMLDRVVALKVFDSLDDQTTVARIEQEVQIWARVNHPNIVDIYGIKFDGSRVYLVVQYIEGNNLKSLLKQSEHRVLGIKKSLTILKQLLYALVYLTDRGVIHRDIKPSNILVREVDEHIFLTDFNTGRSTENYRELTLAGGLVGTTDYMAPEQSDGKPSNLSDVYSAGITLLEMLTGHPLIGSPGLVSILAERRPAVPESIHELLHSMLEIDPEKRTSAKGALEMLQACENQTDWISIDSADRAALALNIPVSVPIQTESRTGDPKIYGTFLETTETASASAFFLSRIEATQAVERSSEFFSGHLHDDYDALLTEARQSFRLWLICAGLAFLIISIGVVLLLLGRPVEGGIVLASDVLVLFIQRLFKQREEYYLARADTKKAHLERGSFWNLAIQTVEGIRDPERKSEKIEEITDALIGLMQEREHTE